MFGLVGNEGIALLHQKKNAKLYDAYHCRKNGKLLMTVGSPGGSTIITSVLQTILNVRIQFEYAGSSKCTLPPPMVT
jgi:gamma-glutamyltranspeptidase/glutathione hydrolase